MSEHLNEPDTSKQAAALFENAKHLAAAAKRAVDDPTTTKAQKLEALRQSETAIDVADRMLKHAIAWGEFREMTTKFHGVSLSTK